jgi:hypothetical protein
VLSPRRMGRTFLEMFVGILGVGSRNPAVLACAILAVSRWRDLWHVSLLTAFMLAYSNYQCNTALTFASFRRETEVANQAVKKCAAKYLIRAANVITLFGWRAAEYFPLQAFSMTVLQMTPMLRVRPWLTFKAFLVDPSSHANSIILIRSASVSDLVDRFYILHEVSHLSMQGYLLHLNALYTTTRLAISYVPLVIMSSGWLPILLLFVLFLTQLFIEKNAPAIELQADKEAWRAYLELFGEQEALEASIQVEHLFKIKAEQGDNIELCKGRAKLAAAFRQTLRGNLTPYELSQNLMAIDFVRMLEGGSISVILLAAAVGAGFARHTFPPFFSWFVIASFWIFFSASAKYRALATIAASRLKDELRAIASNVS